MFHLYFEFRFIVNFLFRYPFSSREADGMFRILVMNFAYSRLSVKMDGVTERLSSAAFSEGV